MINQLSIKSRLVLLGAIAVVGVLVAGGIGINRLASANAAMTGLLDEITEDVRNVVTVEEASVEFKVQVQEWKNILIRGNTQEGFEKYSKAFSASGQKVQEQLAKAAESMRKMKNPMLSEVENVIKLHDQLGKDYAAQIAVWQVGDPGSMGRADQAVRGKDRDATAAMSKLALALEGEVNKNFADFRELAGTGYTNSRNLLTGLILAVALSVLAVVYLTIVSISRQIDSATGTLAEIRSSLDLSLRLPADGKDELSTMSARVNELLGDFYNVVKGMKDGAVEVSKASQELSGSVSQLSASVSHQNEATSSMAASVEEMAVSVTHISDSSNSAQEISRNSLALAQDGGKVIEQTVAEMAGMTEDLQTTSATITNLGQRSQEIGNIAGVIKEIAEQTNLLALNAAIEAARAGEQGRGFAVVADEVRKLAERTAQATTEIEQVIGAVQTETQKTVDEMQSVVIRAGESASVARQAGEVIVSIRKGSGEVVDVTSDISTALKEQTAASDLIAKQVEVIATMSDENSAALASVTQASHQLSSLADKMRGSVERFRV